MKKAKHILGVAVAILATTGCAVVQPWERGTLSEQHMQFRAMPAASQYEAELRRITEGTSFGGGASETAGGGCGCN